MQHASPDGSLIASLNPQGPSILLSDPHGAPRQTIDLGSMKGIAGFRWLHSSEGLAVWTLDTVYVMPVDGAHPPRVAFQVDQPEGDPLAIEDVRTVPDGLLVVAQACGVRHVVREASVVHLKGTRVKSQTSLAPWSGQTLYAATARQDGTIVLALNEPEHIRSAFLQCVARDEGSSQRQRAKYCWYLTLPSRFFASEFRVLEVQEAGVVKVVGQHACPFGMGCYVHNWAHGTDDLVWSDSYHAHRLRSAIRQDPLMPSGGVWGAAIDSGDGALWLRGERILSTGGADVMVYDLEGAPVVPRRSFDEVIHSARFRADGSGAILALPSRIIDLDFATNEARVLVDRLDVPAAFDVRYSHVGFSDAALHATGVLSFDVAAQQPHRSHKRVFPGRSHDGCNPLAPNENRGRLDDLLDEPVSSYRSLGHLTKAQRK